MTHRAYPPIDMCHMAQELGRINPDLKPFTDTIINAVKDANKTVAPYELLKDHANLEADFGLRVPNELMFLAFTLTTDEQSSVVSSLWIPATHNYAKTINRLFLRPADFAADLNFDWVIVSDHVGDRYEFGRQALVVPRSNSKELMAFAPFRNGGVEFDEAVRQQEERVAMSAITAMSALLHLRADPSEALMDVPVNCGTESDFQTVQRAFGPFDKDTWTMNVIMENE